MWHFFQIILAYSGSKHWRSTRIAIQFTIWSSQGVRLCDLKLLRVSSFQASKEAFSKYIWFSRCSHFKIKTQRTKMTWNHTIQKTVLPETDTTWCHLAKLLYITNLDFPDNKGKSLFPFQKSYQKLGGPQLGRYIYIWKLRAFSFCFV